MGQGKLGLVARAVITLRGGRGQVHLLTAAPAAITDPKSPAVDTAAVRAAIEERLKQLTEPSDKVTPAVAKKLPGLLKERKRRLGRRWSG